MNQNFEFYCPTRIYFGKNSIENLEKELSKYGKKVLFLFGFSSIKKIGLYDRVMEILNKAGKEVFICDKVMPNPTYEKVQEACKICKDNNIDLILAVGGGSVIDCAKAIAASTYQEDSWNYFWIEGNPIKNKVIPIGTILTMTGTGSEMNGGSVITNNDVKLKKGHVFEDKNIPQFSILDPEYTYTVSEYQMLSGIFDIFSHLMEQYFSDNEDSVSDYLLEGLMRCLIHNTPLCIKNPKDYSARSNIMWTSTMALNRLVGLSKTQDWEVHSIEHQISAYTDCAHGMGLAAISVAYYRHVYKYGLPQFVKFAVNVWNVDPTGKSDEEIAQEGINRLEQFMANNKLKVHLQSLGCTEEMLPLIAGSADINPVAYKPMTKEEILEILKESF